VRERLCVLAWCLPPAIIVCGTALAEQEHEAHARRVFKQFDKDGTGAIEESELQTVVQQLLPDLTLKSEEWVDFAQSVLIAGDKDGNSALDFEEFFNFYMKCLVSDTAAEKYAAKVQMVRQPTQRWGGAESGVGSFVAVPPDSDWRVVLVRSVTAMARSRSWRRGGALTAMVMRGVQRRDAIIHTGLMVGRS
jgi:Ca2+-binding EF-hand superfamily protein